MSIGLLFIAAIAIVIAVFFARQPDLAGRARLLRRAGFTVMALATLFFGLFVVGDTFADPGGWTAAGLVAAWAAPLAGLAALAWYRPGLAVRVFAVLTMALAGMSIWFAVNPHGWRSFEDGHGPIRAVITFVLAAAIAVLGLKRTAAAGALLLVTGIVPAAVYSLGSLLGFTSLAVVSSAPVITGFLYLLSARMRSRLVPPAHAGAGAGQRPPAGDERGHVRIPPLRKVARSGRSARSRGRSACPPPGGAPHGRSMRTSVTARLALIGGMLAVLAACWGAGQPGTAARSRPPATATVAPVPATATPAPPPVATSGPPSVPAPGPTPPVTPITGWLAGKDWTYIPTTRHVVALTFDAGANAGGVASILATLQRDHIPASFFLTGNFIRDFPASAQQIARAGNRIGDHTITHPYLTQLSDQAVQREILDGAQQITAVTGANPAPLFRFPYGDADTRTIAIANRAGYVPVRWTVDTLGWEGTSGHITTSIVVSRVLSALRPGEIVLMHAGSNPGDHSTLDADALPKAISELRARGYSFVTLDALVG